MEGGIEKERRSIANGPGRRSYDGQPCPFHSELCNKVRIVEGKTESKVDFKLLALFISGLITISLAICGVAWTAFGNLHVELAEMNQTLTRVETYQMVVMKKIGLDGE